MSVRNEDVVAARTAARELARTVQTLSRHFPGSVDLRRLVDDVDRIPEDLDLLCGAEASAPSRPLEVIPDTEYPAELFADADDEGVGPHR